MITLTDAKEGLLSLGDLWETVATLSKHVVEDNKYEKEGTYPV